MRQNLGEPPGLDTLVKRVLASSKYRHVSPDLICRIGSRELSKDLSLGDAVKSTKSKLHQVGGAYFDGGRRLDRLLNQLDSAAASGDMRLFRDRCLEGMRFHASTRERLPILDAYYATLLRDLPPVKSVMDVACGLNPLALPWMQLEADVHYHACDIYSNIVSFVSRFLAIAGITATAEVRDVIADPPAQSVDLAFVLKTLPCLEQIDGNASATVLDAIDARHLLVSYPIRSLGGRSKGMLANYEARFRELAQGRYHSVHRFEFETELAFLVEAG